MAKKKHDLQKDFHNFLEQSRQRFGEFSKELGVLAKRGEKEVVKASRIGKLQLDIVSLNMQKEKLYYEIGKKVASLNARKKVGITELEPYWKRMRKIETDRRKRKQELSSVQKKAK